MIELLAFALSGMATLTYEVVWGRIFQTTFGSTIYAASIILSSFLAGFSIGAYIFRKMKATCKTLALIEVTAAAYAFLIGKLLPNLHQILPSLFALKMLIAILIVLPFSILIGATWPFTSQLFLRKKKVGQDSGKFYAVNSFGSALGSLLTGFVFIPSLGLSKTNLIGVVMNLTAGLLFYIKGGEQK